MQQTHRHPQHTDGGTQKNRNSYAGRALVGLARTFMGAQKTKASAKQLTAATVDLYELSVDFCTGVDRLIKTVLFTTLGDMAVIAGCVLLIFCVSVLAYGGWQLNRVAPLLKRGGAVGVPTPAALQQQEAYALAMKTLGSSTLQRACMQAPAAHEPIVAGSAAAAGALCELPRGSVCCWHFLTQCCGRFGGHLD